MEVYSSWTAARMLPAVSLLQLACQLGPRLGGHLDESENSVVFFVDLLLIPLPSIWELLRDVFVSPDILKLGFRFKQDLVYLSSTFSSHGCNLGFDRVEPFLDITSVYNYLQHKQPGRKMSKDIKSLATICKEVLDISLSKQLQCRDWSHRPLTEDQRTYAAMDAHCLLDIFNIFRLQVIKEGNLNFNLAEPNSLISNLGLKEILEKDVVCEKNCDAADIVRPTACSDISREITSEEGMVLRSQQRTTLPMDESLLKIVNRYGDKLVLKESDKQPKISKRKGKGRSSAGLTSKEKELENYEDWQGPPPSDAPSF